MTDLTVGRVAYEGGDGSPRNTEERVSFTLSELTEMLKFEIGMWARGVDSASITRNAKQLFTERLRAQQGEKP